MPEALTWPTPTAPAAFEQLRRGTPEWGREMSAAGRWRWLLDVPGSPAIPAVLMGAASLGYNGLGPQMTGGQKAGTALVGWAFFGGFGALVLWFVWFFIRVLMLTCALGLAAVWLL